MTREEELRKERAADDRWTGPRLVVLGLVTLGIGLTIIWTLASISAPA